MLFAGIKMKVEWKELYAPSSSFALVNPLCPQARIYTHYQAFFLLLTTFSCFPYSWYIIYLIYEPWSPYHPNPSFPNEVPHFFRRSVAPTAFSASTGLFKYLGEGYLFRKCFVQCQREVKTQNGWQKDSGRIENGWKKQIGWFFLLTYRFGIRLPSFCDPWN